jgi:hypothetical protein
MADDPRDFSRTGCLWFVRVHAACLDFNMKVQWFWKQFRHLLTDGYVEVRGNLLEGGLFGRDGGGGSHARTHTRSHTHVRSRAAQLTHAGSHVTQRGGARQRPGRGFVWEGWGGGWHARTHIRFYPRTRAHTQHTHARSHTAQHTHARSHAAQCTQVFRRPSAVKWAL